MTLRTYAILAAILGVLGVCGLAWWSHNAAEREKGRRVVAEQGLQVASETTKIIDRTFTNERTIYRQAEATADAIQSAPGADAPVPADVLSRWSAGIDGLRDSSEAVDDHGS